MPKATAPAARPDDRLGAHVSAAGGVHTVPARGVAIGATALQLFTKGPSQWKEWEVDDATARAFRAAVAESGIAHLCAHDSYLINLASPDAALRKRSMASFSAELRRCAALGIPYLVSHPGNYIEGLDEGIARNAASLAECLDAVPDGPIVCLETTAGTGTALGRTFEELAALREALPTALRRRVGFCADTCHLYSAGYDLVHDYEGVWKKFDAVLGLEHLFVLHLNDSKTPFASHKDRHELIAEGSLGAAPFRAIMTDPRFSRTMKILETPKGDDEVTVDTKMLRRLRTYARNGAGRNT